MRHVVTSPLAVRLSQANHSQRSDSLQLDKILLQHGTVLATPGITYVLKGTGATYTTRANERAVSTTPTISVPVLRENLRSSRLPPEVVNRTSFESITHLFTAQSLAGYLSGHWHPFTSPLTHAGQDELHQPPEPPFTQQREVQIWLEWTTQRNLGPRFTEDYSAISNPLGPENRGFFGNDSSVQSIRAGDALQLRPIMQALDGNGWLLAVDLQGPSLRYHRDSYAQPNPLGGATWALDDLHVTVTEPGTYHLTLTGTSFWPKKNHIVTYCFFVTP